MPPVLNRDNLWCSAGQILTWTSRDRTCANTPRDCGPGRTRTTGSDVRYPVGGTPVPPRRRGGTAYAERRYQLGAVLNSPLSNRVLASHISYKRVERPRSHKVDQHFSNGKRLSECPTAASLLAGHASAAQSATTPHQTPRPTLRSRTPRAAASLCSHRATYTTR